MFKKMSKIMTIYNKFGFIIGNYIIYKLILSRKKNFKLPQINYSFRLRNMITDIGIFHQIFINEEYNYNYEIKENAVIIDAGANIGLFAIFMKSIYPKSKIICIEPDEDNFILLRENTSKYSDIFYEKSGLWNKKIRLKVYDKFNTGKTGLIVEEDEKNGNVDAIDIDSIIEKYEIRIIDLLKIDIETSEINVFENNYQNWLPKVKVIIIELHDRIEIGCGKAFFQAITNTFNNYRFEVKGENIIIENLDLK